MLAGSQLDPHESLKKELVTEKLSGTCTNQLVAHNWRLQPNL